MTERTCSINGCNRPHCARGWCRMHWTRWSKYGDPLAVHPKGAAATAEAEAERRRKIGDAVRGRKMPPKSEETRRRISEALRGRGPTDAQRAAQRAGQLAVRDRTAAASRAQWEKWRAERGLTAPGYAGLHIRVRKLRGAARNYSCVECGGQARHWSTVHGTDGTDPVNHYRPMCERCHFAYDQIATRANQSRKPGDRAAIAKRMWSQRSPDQRREIGRKVWETRRRNQGRSVDVSPDLPLAGP